jgi:hypothetical protein
VRVPTLTPQLAENVLRAAHDAKLTLTGPRFARYLDNPQTGGPFRMEVGVPIGARGAPGSLQTVELPAGPPYRCQAPRWLRHPAARVGRVLPVGGRRGSPRRRRPLGSHTS